MTAREFWACYKCDTLNIIEFVAAVKTRRTGISGETKQNKQKEHHFKVSRDSKVFAYQTVFLNLSPD